MRPNDDDPIQEIDVTLDDEQRQGNRRPNTPYQKKRGNKKRMVLIVGGIVLALALLGGAAYWWFAVRDTNNQGQTPTGQTNEQSPEDVSQEPTLSPEEAAEKVTFKSDALKLSFIHRRDWTVTESDDKSEITVTSPDVSYQTVNGTVPEGRGVFTLKIRKGASDAQSDSINALNAVKDSEVIAYDEPSDVQRHYTNISYAGLEDAFTTLIVTGSVEYKKGDPLANTLQITDGFYLIAGGFGEDSDNTLSFDQVPTSQISSEAVKQATDIIKSLKIN